MDKNWYFLEVLNIILKTFFLSSLDQNINLFLIAIMKDDTATLASYGLLPSSKVILMGSKPNVCNNIHNRNI